MDTKTLWQLTAKSTEDNHLRSVTTSNELFGEDRQLSFEHIIPDKRKIKKRNYSVVIVYNDDGEVLMIR